jgi:hypothetical protein
VNAAENLHPIAEGWAVIREAFALVFIAELGDRTQFTTIFLATAPAFTFAGLLAGSLLGHALVTGLAVGAGRWIGGRIRERLLYRLSGGCSWRSACWPCARPWPEAPCATLATLALPRVWRWFSAGCWRTRRALAHREEVQSPALVVGSGS